MTVFSHRVVLLLLLASWGSCRGQCDPLVPQYCGLPIPNSFFTVPNSQTPTGVHVNFSPETFPIMSITTFNLVLDISLVTTAWWARHAPKTIVLASVL